MRTLLILVCTVNLAVSGCQTARKTTRCGTNCTRRAAAPIGVATVKPEIKRPRKTAKPKRNPVVETKHAEDTQTPFQQTVKPSETARPAKAEPQPEPQPIPTPQKGHGEDYGWLIGTLQRVHTPEHDWKLRYANLDQQDRWGGSMILAPDARLDEWKDGDRVYVEGEILNDRPSLYLSGPLYRIHSIRPASEVTQIIPRKDR